MGIGLEELAAKKAADTDQSTGAEQTAPPPTLAREQQTEREARSRAAEVYKRWQRNTIATEDLQRQLLQGAKGGASYRDLLLIAAQALALTLDNDLLFKQIQEEVQRRDEKTFSTTRRQSHSEDIEGRAG